MNQAAQRINSHRHDVPHALRSGSLSLVRFFLRYPIILLAFGPPLFREGTANAEVNTSQAHFDIWNILQVGLLFAIATRAAIRLVVAESILIPKQIRSILRLAILLGLLYLASLVYSPSRVITAEFSILYFLMWITIVEFIVDAYRNPPNWMQFFFALRYVSVVLLLLVVLCLPFKPALVMAMAPDAGIRLMGGGVASMAVVGPTIAIISAYSFLYSLESRVRSALFFLAGLAGILASQTRGSELSFFLVFGVLCVKWAKGGRRRAYLLISGSIAAVLLVGATLSVIGGGRVWNAFNRGQDTEGILSASGRTGMWVKVIQYAMDHPQGMGYIAGIRASGIWANSDISMHASLSNIGGTDNSYMETLADAGWLALALYLAVLTKSALLGRRLAVTKALTTSRQGNATRHALGCALWLLVFCLMEAMEGSDFVTPLRQEFYYQNIIIAIILGASGSVLIAGQALAGPLGPATSSRRSSLPMA